MLTCRCKLHRKQVDNLLQNSG